MRRVAVGVAAAMCAILLWVIPASAQSAVAPDAPPSPAGPVREAPLAPVDTPTPVPVLSVIAGLAILTVTLARIALRRRAELMNGSAADIEVVREILIVAREAATPALPAG